jgi:hypothetical protein
MITKNHGPFRLADGWYCLVENVRFGPWPDKGTASAGYATELRKAENSKKRAAQIAAGRDYAVMFRAQLSRGLRAIPVAPDWIWIRGMKVQS